jgi:hypothetical protein
MRMRTGSLVVLTALSLAVAGCSGIHSEPVSDAAWPDVKEAPKNAGDGSIFGPNGITFGGKDKSQDENAGIGVNAFLWRGTLETLSFMPLAQADPFGGVIITDWYQPATGSGERFKATAYILSRQLRADGLKVAIHRQVLQGGQWVDAAVDPTTTTEIENRILSKARELRAEVAGS